jgi:acyl-CoA dehydrogenase
MARRIYTEEHDIFRDAFRKFLAKQVTPYVETWEEEGIISRDILKKMGEYSYLCPHTSEQYGGG